MKKAELEKWYEPLEPHFNSISDAMPSMRFATIEAVLHLLYINAPEADPQKAYLLFAQYQLIGITKCSAMDHLLQNARHTLGYYRSRKYWQDDFSEYCDPKYSAIRAFSVTSDAGGLHLTKAETGYPYSYEKRCTEWERFWNTAGEKKQELPVAEDGRFFYVYQGSENGEAERVYITFPKMQGKPQRAAYQTAGFRQQDIHPSSRRNSFQAHSEQI